MMIPLLSKYSTKKEIYQNVNEIRQYMGLNKGSVYPLNSVQLATSFCKNLTINKINFETTDICGILYKGENTTSIALNESRTEEQQNFDCAHELIHYFFHDISFCKCVCSEKKIIEQERSIEYQANEGSAELLVPYELILPEIKKARPSLKAWHDFHKFKFNMSLMFNVTDIVISFRLESLKYEIMQYLNGTSINNLKILSNTQQTKMGIKCTSFNDIELEHFDEELRKFKLRHRTSYETNRLIDIC